MARALRSVQRVTGQKDRRDRAELQFGDDLRVAREQFWLHQEQLKYGLTKPGAALSKMPI